MIPCINPYEPLLNRKVETKTSYADDSFALKREYINSLQPAQCGNGELMNVDEELFKLPVETLQKLYLSLRAVFTDKCFNSERCKIINCLLAVDQSQWEVLLKQVCFIMPVGTRGHDVMWAIEILSSVVNPAYREQLTSVANRFFRYDTLTTERGYILNSLAKLDSDALSAMDSADEQTRVQFIAEHVPESLKKGAKIVSVYDPIQGRGWKV